jgi:hypothetical protein
MSTSELETLLAAAYTEANEKASADEVAELLFHLRDCRTDLERLVALYREPNKFGVDDAKAALDGLLLHAVGHIVQAARLYYGEVMDPFADQKK